MKMPSLKYIIKTNSLEKLRGVSNKYNSDNEQDKMSESFEVEFLSR